MKKLIICLALFLSLPLSAQTTSELYRLIAEHRNELTEVELFDSDLSNKLDKKTYDALMAVAEDQARVWYDTILEGEYITTGDVYLLSVSSLHYQGQFVGYTVTYAKSAYYTGSCDYDYENEETLEECSAGTIVEQSVVSPDFKEYDIDGDYYADFND